MNLKQLGILLALVVVLGGAGLVVYRNQNASWKGGNADIGKKLLDDLPVNDVAQIAITQGTNQLNLVKKDDLWRVQERHDYPASYSQIRDFLLKAQGLKAVQSEIVGPSQLAALRLAPPGQGTNSALVVAFKGPSGNLIKTLLLGKPHLKKSGEPSEFGGEDLGWPDGRYVRSGDSQTVAVVSDPLENIEPKPGAWLDKDFIRVEKAKSVEVDFPEATNSWKVTRDAESGAWKLADAKPGEQLDAAKTSSLSYALSSPSFTDVLPGAKLEGSGTNPPTLVKIDTFDHFTYTVGVGRKINEEYPVTVAVAAEIPKERAAGKDEKPPDKATLDKEFKDDKQKLEDKLKQERNCENWTYLVSSWTMDPLLKERSQLLVEKKEEPKKDGKTAENAVGKPEASNQEGREAQNEASATPANGGETNSAPAEEP
jgi:hypothetical protein